ncbi:MULTISPECIES: thiamine pyrophosphate-dependent enzyme [unclassified Fusibacter]|uniref:thiamine pyrophosphate-dependent enzyme n=1 Tax=unclassified Fusibacter TaxID=2624464 RepID=UPI001011D83C|nr:MULTISPECIES: thiamine pyrophosphate-dependent enzyme [unclassified Fusibacter]MCK8061334.1 thiamine pyrophosphate-dependent enzyme [Fusibacter sp. A2]NPE23469.1 4Fe-4S binding protein [Fusibacter sp. A1]RXV59075.1 indolepyruvate ferredoxin oxidoreductase [Fusibacter sp. A1]
MKKVLNGNEAVARGFYEAGGLVSASYPGSPTVEIIQTLIDEYDEIYAEFSINEKVAVEVGIGASIAGARTLVAMKHVGVNVAMDPLMTFTQTPINGGFVLISGDDPGMSSSQNEQDNRILAKFAHMCVFDPGDAMEAKVMTKEALSISETFGLPVMVRMTSRVCHSRSIVELEDRVDRVVSGFSKKIEDYGMIPPHTFKKQYEMKNRIAKLQDFIESSPINRLEDDYRSDVLIVTSGLMYQNLKELNLKLDVLKLGVVYPLPIEQIRALKKRYARVIVIEEMMPFIEDELKIHGIACEGKEFFSFTGELMSEAILKGLEGAGAVEANDAEVIEATETVNRFSMFCAGCPHRPVFDILKKNKVSVIGDIGCYSLAVLEPFELVNTIISMGASIGMMKGMSKAYQMAERQEPLVAVIGDGTFYHSGMTGMLNLLHQLDPDYNLTLLILNNGTTAMTGGQQTASSGYYTDKSDMKVDMETLIRSMGFERFKRVDQFEYKAAKKVIDEELKYEGLSIVMTTRACALQYKIVKPHYVVDPDICIGCRSCLKTNCPPILMKAYEGHDKLKSSIAKEMCVGCSVCAQVCPVGAIKSSSAGEV